MSIELRDFGFTGLKVSAVGFGTGKIGGSELTDKKVEKLLNSVLDMGINLIDTARSYGEAEHRIGKFLKHRRTEFILSTKVGYDVEGVDDWTFKCITDGVEKALRILQTDYIDIVHLHSCNKDILEKGEVIEALVTGWQRLKPDGNSVHMAYPRALAGFLERYPGGMKKLEKQIPAKTARELQSGDLRQLISVPRSRFELRYQL